MLKMYLARDRAGSDPAFWTEGWAHQALADMVASCRLHPLREPLARLLPPGVRVLDGGCGLGAWSVAAARQGCRPIGVDFALPALTVLKQAAPALPVCAGRVDALPFASGSLAAYYSGGVIEHFEDGPAAALAEAHRVLAPGGLLLVVVPDLSPLREALHRGEPHALHDAAGPVVGFERVSRPAVGASPWPRLQFFQYLWSAAELRPLLTKAGFAVLWDRGYGVQWALMELAWARRLSHALRGPILGASCDYWDRVPQAPWAQEPLLPRGAPRPIRRLLRRLLTLEDDRVPALGAAVRLLQAIASNIRLYVCRRLG